MFSRRDFGAGNCSIEEFYGFHGYSSNAKDKKRLLTDLNTNKAHNLTIVALAELQLPHLRPTLKKAGFKEVAVGWGYHAWTMHIFVRLLKPVEKVKKVGVKVVKKPAKRLFIAKAYT